MKKIIFFLCTIAIFSCNSSSDAPVYDTVYFNGPIYTAIDENPSVEAIGVKDGKIAFAGKYSDLQIGIKEATVQIDLNGQTLIPGFIESHAHIMGIGYNELNLDLMGTKSYEQIIQEVEKAVAEAQPGDWILGRGWHQSKWDSLPEQMVKGFPLHQKLSEVSPNNPVFLRHASGHAALANAKAMEMAGLGQLNQEKKPNYVVEGGEIILDELGNPTGIFNERAMGKIFEIIPESTESKDERALELAIKACQRNGITSFHDAGASRKSIALFKKFKKENKLGTRLYVMVTGFDETLVNEFLNNGPEIDSTEHLLTIRSIKLNCDGALGSRGAWLLAPYSDRPDHVGMATLSMDYVAEISKKGVENGFQVCAHAIGDRANREILDRYEQAFTQMPDKAVDHRFRIEHAQHINGDDIPRFASLGVIPAMQAIHMSSDRPWAIDRLGEERIKEGAYVWQKLLQSGVKIANGTDAPVEPLAALPSFYASVSRKTLKGTPSGGYEPDQKMTRQQALQSYTIFGAYAAFEEEVKGSLEVGKLADFTILDKDIMTIEEAEILKTSVVKTILGGVEVYSADQND